MNPARLKEPVIDIHGRISSPCISVCIMDARSGCCTGCARNLSEIAAWGQASEIYKREVWAQLPSRLAAMEKFEDLKK